MAGKIAIVTATPFVDQGIHPLIGSGTRSHLTPLTHHFPEWRCYSIQRMPNSVFDLGRLRHEAQPAKFEDPLCLLCPTRSDWISHCRSDVAVNMATSRHAHDNNQESAVFNRVNHAVVADSDTPQVVSTDEASYPGRPGIVRQRCDLPQHASTNGPVETVKLFLRGARTRLCSDRSLTIHIRVGGKIVSVLRQHIIEWDTRRVIIESRTRGPDVLGLLQRFDSRSPRRSDVGRNNCRDPTPPTRQVHNLAIGRSVHRLRRYTRVRRKLECLSRCHASSIRPAPSRSFRNPPAGPLLSPTVFTLSSLHQAMGPSLGRRIRPSGRPVRRARPDSAPAACPRPRPNRPAGAARRP
jgi:hypothetical protein